MHGLGSMTFGLVLQKFLSDFFTENSIKLSEMFLEELECAISILGKILVMSRI